VAQRPQLTFVLLLGPCFFDRVATNFAGGRLGLGVPQDGAQGADDDLRGRPQGFPPSSREVPLQRRGVQVPTALHQERPRDGLGER